MRTAEEARYLANSNAGGKEIEPYVNTLLERIQEAASRGEYVLDYYSFHEDPETDLSDVPNYRALQARMEALGYVWISGSEFAKIKISW